MAGISRKSFQSVSKICNVERFWWLKGSCFRLYSVFSPDFKEPTVDKEKIKEIIQKNSEQEILTTRFKPALSSQTCSVFYHPDLEKFINCLMRKGKKHVARKVVEETFIRVKHIQIRKYNNETDPNKRKDIIINPLDLFLLAIKNVTPMLWYIKIKRSGSWYKVPVGISDEKAKGRAMKWLIEVANDKNSKTPLEVQLATEIIAAANYEGRTLAKKIEMHKMCEANRGYVNYWWT